jgi:hypothetical protein
LPRRTKPLCRRSTEAAKGFSRSFRGQLQRFVTSTPIIPTPTLIEEVFESEAGADSDKTSLPNHNSVLVPQRLSYWKNERRHCHHFSAIEVPQLTIGFPELFVTHAPPPASFGPAFWHSGASDRPQMSSPSCLSWRGSSIHPSFCHRRRFSIN